MSVAKLTPLDTGKPVIIVDGSSYLFRAFHALPALTNSKGEPTGAIKGVQSMLQKLINTYQPELMCVVFDTKGPNFRHELYPEYKANRGAPAPELIAQIEPLHQLVKAMGLPLLAISGIEADDIIATLAQQAADSGHRVLISSGDKDLAQLVNGSIELVNTMSQERLDIQGVQQKFNVTPEQIVDYLALIGDKSDNIPGIDKVGPKTAAKWLAEYGDIDTLLEHKDTISGKIGENLRNQVERLILSRQLVQLQCELELPISIADLKLNKPDSAILQQLFEQLEFKNELRQLLEHVPAPIEATQHSLVATTSTASRATYRTLTTHDEISAWLEQARQADSIVFDTETTSLAIHDAKLVGVSLAINSSEAVYIPCGHRFASEDETPVAEQLNCDELLQLLKPILEAAKPVKIGQNLKYDINVLRRHGVEVTAIGGDTMLQSYVLNPSVGRHDMDSLAMRNLQRTTITFESIAGKGVKQKTFDMIPLDIAADYAAEDAEITWLLSQKLSNDFAQYPELKAIYETIELPLVPILARMEYFGALIDAAELQVQTQTLGTRLADLAQQAFDLVGEEFNLSSPKQIGTILYEKMQIPILKKTPKGAPSTAENVLQDLAKDYELPRLLLEHRSLAKLQSTYTDKLPELIHADTGRVHTSYHQAVTATGRLSSSNPNLQNIPIKTAEGRAIRKAFIAAPGHKLVAADYSQIELRIMAHLSNDERLLQSFAAGEDIHSATAAEVFATTLAKVTSTERRAAKAINFGLIYGMSAFGLANQLGINRHEAQHYIDQYFQRYPGVETYMNQTRLQATDQGYVETLFGRRLYLPDLQSRNHAVRTGAERAAINAPMQGTAADIMKLAMIELANWLEHNKLSSQMIMQVHDEIVLEVPTAELEQVLAAVPKVMSEAAQLNVPLLVEIGAGDNWLEAH